MSTTILFNKPYRVMSQFSACGDKQTLTDYIELRGVYPAGRLDYDSEGLMLLTSDGRLQAQVSHPRYRKTKVYLAQVERIPGRSALLALRRGVSLKDGITAPAKADLVEPPDWLWERRPPIRQRREIPTQWIRLAITEGRNRQVRRMTASVGHPTLRLIRVAIDCWTLDGLNPGDWRVI